MMAVLIQDDLSALDRAILHTVVYADVFDFPLRAGEIHRYLTGFQAAPQEVLRRLEQLVPGQLSRSGEFYMLPGREELVTRRLCREQVAAGLWLQAQSYGRLLAGLPFVRMLAVTGSLAVNNVEAGADLDFLVVTKPGRLWLCRALILALGRLAEIESLRICPNYLISERSLVFPEQNLYAAHELTQMVPLSGRDVYDRIRSLNDWVYDYLPNAQGLPFPSFPVQGGVLQSMVRSLFEGALSTPAGSWLEQWEMERKIKKLRQANGKNPEASFSVDWCKGHFNHHGQRTQRVLLEKLKQLSLEVVP